MSADDKHSFSFTIAQKIKEELSNPEFFKLLQISDEIGKLVFKLEKKYDLPDTDKVGMSWDAENCSLMLLDYMHNHIPDTVEIPQLKAMVKEEMAQKQKYKESKGIPTVIN